VSAPEPAAARCGSHSAYDTPARELSHATGPAPSTRRVTQRHKARSATSPWVGFLGGSGSWRGFLARASTMTHGVGTPYAPDYFSAFV